MLRFLQETDKSYRGRIVFGVATDTLDAAGAVLERAEMPVTRAQLEQAARAFIGAIEQVPPMVSALKVGGRKLYELARNGEEIERQARPIRIDALACTERQTSAELVAHLAALELRPSLHAAHGYGSLFAYCTEHLHLSEELSGSLLPDDLSTRAWVFNWAKPYYAAVNEEDEYVSALWAGIEMIKTLERNGFIERTRRQARSIRLLCGRSICRLWGSQG